MSPTEPKAPPLSPCSSYHCTYQLATCTHSLLRSTMHAQFLHPGSWIGSMGLHGFVLARMGPRLTEGTNQMPAPRLSGGHAPCKPRRRRGRDTACGCLRDRISCAAGWCGIWWCGRLAVAVSVRHECRRRYARRAYVQRRVAQGVAPRRAAPPGSFSCGPACWRDAIMHETKRSLLHLPVSSPCERGLFTS